MAGATMKAGSEYVALANLSVPRIGRKPDDPNDLVPARCTVLLTEEQAAPFLNRRPPVIMLKAEAEARGIPVLPPKSMAGRLFRPPDPGPASDQPRPDPEGSSHLVVFDDPRVPESHEPQIDSETRSATGTVDIAPSGDAQALAAAARRTARGGR